MTLQLEVGKTYLNRRKEKVKIVDQDYHSVYPFNGDDELSYMKSGRYYEGKESANDLIKEVDAQITEEQKQIDSLKAELEATKAELEKYKPKPSHVTESTYAVIWFNFHYPNDVIRGLFNYTKIRDVDRGGQILGWVRKDVYSDHSIKVTFEINEETK